MPERIGSVKKGFNLGAYIREVDWRPHDNEIALNHLQCHLPEIVLYDAVISFFTFITGTARVDVHL